MMKLIFSGAIFCFFFNYIATISHAQVSLPSPTTYFVGEGGSCSPVALSGNIILTESASTDFSNGTNVSYVIELPDGFEFANTDPNSIHVVYTPVSGTSTWTAGSSPNAFNFPSGKRRRFQFYYTITNTSNDVGSFTISNISVTCYNAGSFGNINRSGGNAIQAGNGANAQSHGFLDSRASISCVTYNPVYTTLVPITAPHVSCSSGNLYFYTNQFATATYTLYEGTTARSTTTSGNASSGTYGLPGIVANSSGGYTTFNVEVTKTDGCTFRSEDIDFNFTTTPKALVDYSYQSPFKDTIFPKSAPVVDLNSYLSLAASDQINYFSGPGVFNTGGNSYVFDPGSVITGQNQLYYSLTNGTCTKNFPMGHKFTVYDPLEPPPSYITATDMSNNPKSYPYCENGGKFRVTFHPPAGKVLTYVYLYRRTSGTQYGAVSLPVDGTAGPYTINPTTDDYNGRLYTYIYYKDFGSTDNYQYFENGYITIFPERKPQLLGLPPHNNDTLLLCTVGKDSVIMHANPIGGQYIIEKFKGTGYTKLIGTDLNLFAQKPLNAPDNTYKAFVPETLYNTLGESDDQIKFKVTYIYPPIGLSFCPDTIIKYFRFVKPVNVTYTIAPSTLPHCHGDTLWLTVNNSSPNDKFYWNFGDGISKEADSLTFNHYLYSRPGKYALRFKSIVSVLPQESCNNDILDTIRIGAKPVADFVVSNNYEKQQADFSSLAVLRMNNPVLDNGLEDKLNSWSWDFGDGHVWPNQTDSLQDNTYDHYKAKPYTVTHVVQSGWGCRDTVKKEIPVFPVIGFSVKDFYGENYDATDSTGFYQSGDYKIGGNASWRYQPPAGDSLIISASPAWVTENNKTDTSYNFDEFSWVESPAFLFDQLEMPMLSLDTWCLSENQLDGACLQWAFADTTFGNEKWQTIGIKGQGVNWYNSNIVVGMLNKVKKVGIHTPGWTGSTGSQWQTSKFNLDNIKAQAGTRPVRFRILFVSNSDNAPGQYDGFAFDNFYIGKRNRKVLVEEFCDYQHYEPEFTVSPFQNNPQLVRMQYHTRYMTLDDEINNQNKGETGARNLLYGYSELPRAAVDGSYSLDYEAGFFGTGSSVGIGEQKFDKRLLELSPFSISFDIPSPVVTNGALTFSVNVTRDSTIATQGPFVIQVAVLEKMVVGNSIPFTHVFRKFLPDAGGEHVSKNEWATGTTKQLSRTFVPYTPLTTVADSDTSLILVAFVQDELTSEIYQAETSYLFYADVKTLNVVPMAGRIDFSEPAVSLYPNPASSKLTLRFENQVASEDYEYRLMDNFGKVVRTGQILKDTYEANLSGLESLPVGLYQVQLFSSQHSVTKSFSLVR